MGKKSREKRERRDGALKAEGERLVGELRPSILQDDPGDLRALAALHGRRWLLETLPRDPMPFPYILARDKAARCLAAYIDLAAQEAGAWFDDDERSDDDDTRGVKTLGEGFFALSTLAMACSRDGDPHPAKEIREAIASIFEHFRGGADNFAAYKPNFHPLVAEDWSHVREERAAEDCRMALEETTIQTTKTSGPRDIDKR